MPKVTEKCPYCGKTVALVSAVDLGEEEIIESECGHSFTRPKVLALSKDLYDQIAFEDGAKPYPFQIEGLKFSEKANFRNLIADEMGLGKTIQALIALKTHPELLPALILTKANLTHQWFSETLRVCGKTDLDYIPQLLQTSKEQPNEFFKVWICSIDLLKSIVWPEGLAPKTIIIDECQSIKNADSKRAYHVRKLAQGSLRKKREIKPNLPEREKIEVIATDLMKWFGVSERFTLNFEKLGGSKLGMTECKAHGDGTISGRITIDLSHSLHANEGEIIETILHEIAHAITPGAGHKPIWADTCRDIGGNGQAFAYCSGSEEFKGELEQPKHIIALSGTPIKNNATEYFTILNILRPDKFSSYQNFIARWVDFYQKGTKTDGSPRMKVGGIKPRELLNWKAYTDDFIIRRTRNQVLPDLPKIVRGLKKIELDDIEVDGVKLDVVSAYRNQMKLFLAEYDEAGDVTDKNMMHLLAYISKMRHITGVAKITFAADHILEFLESTDRKLVVFYHHLDVADLIFKHLDHAIKNEFEDKNGLSETIIVYTKSSQDKEMRNQLEETFKNNPKARIMLASTLGSGEGKNWQFCKDALMLERQWNSVNEEQAEGRFSRIGATNDPVSVNYLTCIDSIDEYFAELVDEKRVRFAQTMDNREVTYDELSITKQLAQVLATKGRKAWQL